MEEYLDELIAVFQDAEHAVKGNFVGRTVSLTSLFRAPC